jgi:SPP1 family phage portal protein
MTERSFKKTLNREYNLLSGAWGKARGARIDPAAISFTFTRDIPFSLKEELETMASDRGHLSDKTLYSLMSFIKDPEAEIEQLKREEKERTKLVDLDSV